MTEDTGRHPRRSPSVTAAALMALASFAGPFRLVDTFTAEESAVRKGPLKFYARFEVQLLRFFYRLLNRPFVMRRWVRKSLYHALARFMSRRAVTRKVMALPEVEGFIEGLPAGGAVAVGPCRRRPATRACDEHLSW